MKIRKITALCLSAAMAATMLTGCGINKNATIATMGDTKIKMGLVNFMCRYEQADMDDLYRAYFGDDVWSQDLYGSGSTMEDTTKSDVMDEVHDLYTLADPDHMEKYGVSLTDEDEAAITEAATAFMNANSKDALKEMGATQDIVEEMLRLYTIKSKMHAAIIATVDTEVSDEEANMRSYTVLGNGISTYYDSSSGSYVEYTDDEKAQIELAFELVAAQISAGNTLEDAAEMYGLSTSTDTYSADDDSLDETLKEALDNLKEGETSGVITTDDVIYIVRIDSDCDEEATEENRQNIIETRQDDEYDAVLAAWQEEDGWEYKEKLLDEISFFNTFTQETETEESTESSTEEAAETVDGTEAQ